MNKFTKRIGYFFVAFVAAFLLATLAPLNNLGINNTAVVEAAAKINTKNVKMTKGKTYTIKVKGASGKAKFTSSNKKIATVNSKTGKITAKKKGTAVIKVKVDGKSFKVNVKVETPSLNASTITVNKGQSYKLKLNNTSRKITWKSNNAAVATVNGKGVVTGKRKGEATITAKISDKTFSCKVKVGTQTVINCQDNITIGVGESQEYTLTAGDGFKYSSGKGFIDVSISPMFFRVGDTLIMTIKGNAVGTDTITFTSDGGWTKTITVTVTGATLPVTVNNSIPTDVTINDCVVSKSATSPTRYLFTVAQFHTVTGKKVILKYTFFDASNNIIKTIGYKKTASKTEEIARAFDTFDPVTYSSLYGWVSQAVRCELSVYYE